MAGLRMPNHHMILCSHEHAMAGDDADGALADQAGRGPHPPAQGVPGTLR